MVTPNGLLDGKVHNCRIFLHIKVVLSEPLRKEWFKWRYDSN